MTYQQKLDSVIALINEHNAFITEESNKVNSEGFINCLKASGATTEERLNRLSYEELLQCLPSCSVTIGNGSVKEIQPVLLAKDIAKIFREKYSIELKTGYGIEASLNDSKYVSNKKAERMTLEELVSNYDPEEPDSAIGKRLKQISKDYCFIVFSNGRTVDVETTVKLLKEIKQGYSSRKNIEIDGIIYPTNKVGYLPDNEADENPIYFGRPLRPDGTCDQLGRSWEGVHLSVRIMVYLIASDATEPISIETAHNILDMALSPDAMKKLRTRYREAALKYDMLQKISQLPNLKVPLKPSNQVYNPLNQGNKAVWNEHGQWVYYQKPTFNRNKKG